MYIYLNEPYVLNGSYVNNTSLMVIKPNQAFYLSAQYLATSLHDPIIFIFL